MKRLISLLIVVIMLSINSVAFSADLNSTKYLLKGETAPFSGFLVEKERIEKSVQAVQELEYMKKLKELNEKYYEEKLKNEKLTAELELKKEKLERAAVEKGLKDELKEKNAFYRQPWFVSIVTAGIVFVITGGVSF